MLHEQAILQMMAARGLGARKISRILDALTRESKTIEEFVASSIEEISNLYGLTESIAMAIKDSVNDVRELSEELESHGIVTVLRNEQDYPAKIAKTLGDKAPPVLFTKGEFSILSKLSVGFCGSRKCSKEGLQVTVEMAGQLAGQDNNIVSGYAQGVDTASHLGALSAGGVTTVILAEGIFNFRLKEVLADHASEDNVFIISEFFPSLRWHVSSAMQRNWTICGLSDVVVLVEPGITGGTFAAGQAALELQRPLFVIENSDNNKSSEGCSYFIKRGGIPIEVSEGKILNLGELTDVQNSQRLSSRDEPVQQELF